MMPVMSARLVIELSELSLYFCEVRALSARGFPKRIESNDPDVSAFLPMRTFVELDLRVATVLRIGLKITSHIRPQPFRQVLLKLVKVAPKRSAQSCACDWLGVRERTLEC